jgi:hypothetical protein
MIEPLTINQAAARLGISERTLRKRISKGEIKAEKEPLEAGGMAWRVWLDGSAPEIEPEAERKNAPETLRKPFESESASDRKRSGSEMETAPEVSEPRAGSEPEARIVERLESEVLFLRSMLEARERDAAELRSALREALKAMPKALEAPQMPQPEKEAANPTPLKKEEAEPQRDAQAPKRSTPRDAISATNAGANRRKMRPWQRVAARILGIR